MRLKKPNSPEQWVFKGTFVLIIYLIIGPLFFLIYQSFRTPSTFTQPGFWTLSNYLSIFNNPNFLNLAYNTVVFALGSTLIATFFGIFLAWVNTRTNTPLKKLFFSISLISLIMPKILFTISFIFLFSPKIGIIKFFNIYSLGGMIWLEGLSMAPLVFLLMSSVFSSINIALEEMALISGASILQTFRLITLSLAAPSVFSIIIIIFIKSFTSFEIPAILGLPIGLKVFTSEIFLALRQYPANYGQVSAYSTVLLSFTAFGILLSRFFTREPIKFATITGKGYYLNPLNLGAWRYLLLILIVLYFILTIFLPFIILLWSSLLPYYQEPSLKALNNVSLTNYKTLSNYPHIVSSAKLSFILSGVAASIIMFLSSLISWICIKSQFRHKLLLESLASAPLSVPGLILAIAIMFVYLNLPLGIYGTILLLVIGYVSHDLPYGIRYTNSSMLQIHSELEEAALMSGANWWQQFTKITFPLLKVGLISGWIYVFISSIRQLSIPLILYTPGSEVLAVTIWDLWNTGNYVLLSALGTLMIIFIFLLAGLVKVFKMFKNG